jgi:hypothetical protein
MEDKVYAYLQQHQGLQSIDSVACALECNLPAVLNASISHCFMFDILSPLAFSRPLAFRPAFWHKY